MVSLKKIIKPTTPVAVLLITVCVALWFLPIDSYIEIESRNVPLADFLQRLMPDNWVLCLFINLIITVSNGLLLWLLNKKFVLIRERTFLLLFTFLLLSGTWESTHYLVTGHLAATFVIVSFFIFLDMYHRSDATELAFLGSFLVATASLLLIPPLVLLLLPVWIGFIMMRAFSLRTFLASLVGVITPAILCFATQIVEIQQFFVGFTPIVGGWNSGISNNLPQIIYILLQIVLGILALIGIYTNSLLDVVRTRVNLNYVVLFLVFSVGIAIFYWEISPLLLPLIAALYAIVFSQPMSLRSSTYYTVLFCIFCGINLLYLFGS